MIATPTEIRLDYDPTPKQCEAHKAPETNILYGGAVGGGKSVWLVMEALQLLVDYPGNVGYLCRHEYASFQKTTEKTLERFWPYRLIASHNHTEHEIKLINGSMLMYGGLGDDERGMRRLLSMDLGFFGIDQAEETTETHFFTLSSRLRLNIPGIRYKALLSANPQPGWVMDRFITQQLPDHRFIPALPSDNTHLPPDYVPKLRLLYANRPNLIKSLLDGVWDIDMSGDYLMTYSLIRAAVSRSVPNGSPCVLGVDVARFGDDETVVMVRRGLRISRIETWSKQDTVFTSGKVADIARQEGATAIYVDEIGIGAGVVDPLRANHFNVIGVNSSEKANEDTIYANKRAELYCWLGSHFGNGSVSIPDNPKLTSQLAGMKYKFDTHHRKIIESKDEIRKRTGRSPDYADACMLAFSDFKPDTGIGNVKPHPPVNYG